MTGCLETVARTAIFSGRNIDKSANGKAREGAALGQTKNLFDELAKFEGKIGNGAKTALNALKEFSRSSKPLEYAGVAADFASKHVNPLICVSSGIDVLMSDDKEYALATNAAGLGAMFGVEHLMKQHLGDVIDSVKTDVLKIKDSYKTVDKVVSFAQRAGKGKLTPIIKGVAFVVGSCAAYSAGEKFGKLLLGREEAKSKE